MLYDENMVEEFGNKENVSSILENVISFAQYWMKHETLEIKFDLKFEMIHMEDVYMDLDARNLELVVDFINGYEGFPYADYVIAIWYEDENPPLEFFGKLCNQNPPLEVDYEWFFSGPGLLDWVGGDHHWNYSNISGFDAHLDIFSKRFVQHLASVLMNKNPHFETYCEDSEGVMCKYVSDPILYHNMQWKHWTSYTNDDMKNNLQQLDPLCLTNETNTTTITTTTLTTTTATMKSPKCRNFWNNRICNFIKSISRKELNDKHCLAKDSGMTAFIRAHCYRICCQCCSDRCPDVTEQTLWARKFKLNHALKLFNGISEKKS